jgi:hypothetical protein
MPPAVARINVNLHELGVHLERARAALGEDGYQQLKAAMDTLAYLTQLVEDKTTTIRRLRQLLFGARTEKTGQVLPTEGPEGEAAAPANPDGPSRPPGASGVPQATAPPEEGAAATPSKGHGRNGVEAYAGARKIPVAHASVKPGDRCPGCLKGQVYAQREPGVLVRIVGQAPLMAAIYACEKLRCNLCGEVFTAEPPAGVGTAKYDATAASMIALLKYGSGVPFHRLAGLQGNLGIPLPASTQWEIVEATASGIAPIYAELIRQAAQGEVLHNDDTPMKILALIRDGPPHTEDAEDEDQADPAAGSARTGVFTSGIVSTQTGQAIALFFTGHQHAGENLAAVLARRAKDLGPPIQMCDALARNLPKPFAVIVAHCLAHARRRFVNVAPSFPAACRYVLELLREVYQHDARAKEMGLSPEERLHFHQAHSSPRMQALETWCATQFAERTVEPNSGLGQAITYLQHHWERLTLFLRQPGAPLDNNRCERALKKAILHRKSALFYKTEHGAHVGDLFMSLIHTCELAGANPFDYLTALQTHADALSASPQDWMPWNYRETLDRGG